MNLGSSFHPCIQSVQKFHFELTHKFFLKLSMVLEALVSLCMTELLMTTPYDYDKSPLDKNDHK